MSDSDANPYVRVALLGAGSRGVDAYGAYVLRRPDLARIVAVAEPREDRLMFAAQLHEVGPVHCYASWEDLLNRETDIDAVVIATPDTLHLKPALASIEKGLSILLEKPICPSEEDVLILRDAARQRNADITVAHVLRHTHVLLADPRPAGQRRDRAAADGAAHGADRLLALRAQLCARQLAAAPRLQPDDRGESVP